MTTEQPGASPALSDQLGLQPERAAFEKWLMEVHMLDGTWNDARNCYDEFPCHLAFKAWCAASALGNGAEAAVDEIGRLRAAVRVMGATLAWQCFADTITCRTFDDEVPLEPREAIELGAAALRPNV